jgi:hypothetical protein
MVVQTVTTFVKQPETSILENRVNFFPRLFCSSEENYAQQHIFFFLSLLVVQHISQPAATILFHTSSAMTLSQF